MVTQKITPFLWFNENAEEAMRFYVSVFPNSKLKTTTHYGDAGPGPKGSVMTVTAVIDGLEVTAINGGPVFKLTEAFSLVVACDDQKEVDMYWEKLLAGGGIPSVCGWLTDRFGLSWQVTPKRLIELMQEPDPVKSQRVMKAMMEMAKIDIAALEKARAG